MDLALKQDRHGPNVAEMAIILGIVGSAITLALPAYSEYAVRGKVVEVIDSAESAKGVVEEYAATYGELPAAESISLPFVNSRFVLSSAWTTAGAVSAIIVATRSVANESELDSKKVALTATYNAKTKQVDWVCGGTSATTISRKYLPGDCQ
jgi:type IV pilus assembly protein PilA